MIVTAVDEPHLAGLSLLTERHNGRYFSLSLLQFDWLDALALRCGEPVKIKKASDETLGIRTSYEPVASTAEEHQLGGAGGRIEPFCPTTAKLAARLEVPSLRPSPDGVLGRVSDSLFLSHDPCSVRAKAAIVVAAATVSRLGNKPSVGVS